MARDFYEDLAVTNKYHSLVNFFELFHSLSESGPEIRRYMVMNEFIGRLLNFYYFKSSDNKHYFQNLSTIPTYEIFCNDREEELTTSRQIPDSLSATEDLNVEFDYGLRLQKRKNDKDYLIVEKEKKVRERKYSSDDESPHVAIKGKNEGDEKRYGYLWRVISSLVCSCKFNLSGRYIGDDSMFLNTATPNILPINEEKIMGIIVSERVVNDLAIRNSPSVSTREAICTMYAHLMWENEEVTNDILRIVVHELCNQECTFIDVIKQTPLMITIAKINDSLSPSRAAYIMNNLYEKSFVTNYQEFIKYSDSLLNLLLDYVRRNGDACRYLRNLEDPLFHIEKFNDKNPIPKAYGSKQDLFKKLTNERVDRQLTEDDKNLLTSYAEHRLQLFKELLIDIDYEDHITDFLNSEILTTNMIYIKDDPEDYFKEEYKFWIEATVNEDYGPVMQVSYKIPNVIVRSTKSAETKHNVKINKDSVRPAGMFTNNMVYQINGIYEFLYSKAIESEKSYGRSHYSRYA